MRFEDCLNDILNREGLTQTEAAKKCGLDRANFNKYVTGKREPHIGRAADILWSLGYNLKIEKR